MIHLDPLKPKLKRKTSTKRTARTNATCNRTTSRKPKQLELTGKGLKKPNPCFGGSLLGKGNPKVKRPIDSRLPIHLVLKAKKGVLRLYKTQRIVDDEVYRWAKKCGVTIYEYANAGDHLHAAICVKKLSQWSRFIRGLTGSIARKVQKAGISIQGGLWKKRPYTRVAQSWQRAFKSLKNYVMHNRWEAEGNVNPKRRQDLKMLYELWREDALMSTG